MTNTPQSSQENPGGLEGMAGRLAGSEMFNRITELFSETNPQLDRMKESILDDLNGLRKSPNLESLAINMWKSAEAGLRKDLAELGVSDAETAAAIAGAREKWNAAIHPEQMKEILESPEKQALDAYISDVGNLPVLTEIMKTAQPRKNWEIWVENITKRIPGLSAIAGPLLAFLGIKGKPAEAIQKALEGGKKKEKPAAAADNTPAAAPAPETKEATVNLTEEQKAALKPLENAELKIETEKVQEDMKWLIEEKKLDQEKIVAIMTKAAQEGSNLRKINKAIVEYIGDGKINFQLKDAYMFDGEQLTEAQINFIADKIKNVKNDPVTVRKLLDNTHNINKGDADGKMLTVLEFEKLKAPAV